MFSLSGSGACQSIIHSMVVGVASWKSSHFGKNYTIQLCSAVSLSIHLYLTSPEISSLFLQNMKNFVPGVFQDNFWENTSITLNLTRI